MDTAELAQQITALLAPFLPYLVGKVGDAVVEVTVEKSVERAWERAKALWVRLRPKVEAKPAIQEAARRAAESPDDEDAHVALRLQLETLLAEDQTLARAINGLLQQTRIETDVRVDKVLPGGEVTGVEADTVIGADVRSRVEAGKVEGKIAGVAAKHIGGEREE